jgi:gamma-glutamyltranspeptidase/glutathione hydrolase
VLSQLDLAAVLGQLRQKGPGDLHGGMLGRQLVEAAQRSGAALTLTDLREYTPRFLPTARLEVGNEVLHVPPQGVTGGEFVDVWNSAGSGAPAAGSGVGAASLLAMDLSGSAVSCALTMNAPFGSGLMAAGTGVLLAAPVQRVAAAPFGVGLVINHNVNEFRYAVASAGGGAAANAARTTDVAVRREQPVDAAVAAVAAQTAGSAPVNALACPKGVPSHPGSCQVAVDPRHSGYGLLVGKPQ